MTPSAMHLSISTPDQLIDRPDVRSIRAMDESGSFGLLPGHADLLTMLAPSVVRWRDTADTEHYCAVRGGILTMTGGDRVAIACRQAVLGDRLEELEADVVSANERQEDTDRRARVAQLQLHARAVRQIMRYLVPGGSDLNYLAPDVDAYVAKARTFKRRVHILAFAGRLPNNPPKNLKSILDQPPLLAEYRAAFGTIVALRAMTAA